MCLVAPTTGAANRDEGAMATYDLIVVGGGTAGLVTAAGSAGIGARVALIERDRLGGECLWNGCVPSKALIAASRAAHDAQEAVRFGVVATSTELEFGRVMDWVREAQQRIAPHDSPEHFRSLGVDVIAGSARFTGDRTLDVDGKSLSAKRIVIATGSKPAVPLIDGLEAVNYLTNETIFSLERQPKTLLILGAGAVGLELAQAFARLGTHVQVIEAAPQLLPREDHELAELLSDRLRSEGVEIHLDSAAELASQQSGRVQLHISGANARVFEGDALLVATGRMPNLESLDLAKAGVEVTKPGVVVDDTLRTTARGVWAAGDCIGPLRFTHVADYQARLVVRNAFFPFHSKADYSVVPWVTFSEPELAHVGLTEREARERLGSDVRVWRREFNDVDRAIVDGNTDGLVKLITDRKGRIVGGHILGHGAGNMIGEVVLAMKHGISASALGNTIHAYPTYPEAIRQAAEGHRKSRFRGPVKRIANWFARH
jgi:pyruvate/2-oxoglutarate dehydrogenase complex dihydrolipoamide dehydrogenase (E3) component